MNFAQMLMTGPKLSAPEERVNPNKYDEDFVKDVLMECLPGNTNEICEKSGYSSRLVVRYMKMMIAQGLVQTRTRKTGQFGSTRIYEKVRPR